MKAIDHAITHTAPEHVAEKVNDPKHPGKFVYIVPIQDRPKSPAIVDADDYERILRDETCPRLWYAKKSGKHEYVTIKSERRRKNNQLQNNVPVVWLILGIFPEHRVHVRYIDGDRRNLRRENLKTVPRGENPYVQAARAAKAAAGNA